MSKLKIALLNYLKNNENNEKYETFWEFNHRGLNKQPTKSYMIAFKSSDIHTKKGKGILNLMSSEYNICNNDLDSEYLRGMIDTKIKENFNYFIIMTDIQKERYEQYINNNREIKSNEPYISPLGILIIKLKDNYIHISTICKNNYHIISRYKFGLNMQDEYIYVINLERENYPIKINLKKDFNMKFLKSMMDKSKNESEFIYNVITTIYDNVNDLFSATKKLKKGKFKDLSLLLRLDYKTLKNLDEVIKMEYGFEYNHPEVQSFINNSTFSMTKTLIPFFLSVAKEIGYKGMTLDSVQQYITFNSYLRQGFQTIRNKKDEKYRFPIPDFSKEGYSELIPMYRDWMDKDLTYKLTLNQQFFNTFGKVENNEDNEDNEDNEEEDIDILNLSQQMQNTLMKDRNNELLYKTQVAGGINIIKCKSKGKDFDRFFCGDMPMESRKRKREEVDLPPLPPLPPLTPDMLKNLPPLPLNFSNIPKFDINPPQKRQKLNSNLDLKLDFKGGGKKLKVTLKKTKKKINKPKLKKRRKSKKNESLLDNLINLFV